MRLHPAVGMPLQRVVPPGGRVIAGRFYRAGTLVGMTPREIHLDSRAYGNDASEWCPERWLEGDRGQLEKYNLVVRRLSIPAPGPQLTVYFFFSSDRALGCAWERTYPFWKWLSCFLQSSTTTT
jgi:cytochrome P450